MRKSLVILACHSVLRDLACNPLEASSWVLFDHQHGEPHYYPHHIQVAADTARRLDASLLFSGGVTRNGFPWSEALSYLVAAKRLGIVEDAILEEFALDSLQNVLFGIARFREISGEMPEQVSVVSWEFKRERFWLHATAIGIASQFEFVSAGNPDTLSEALAGEARARSLFIKDPLGTTSPLLDKRVTRNPYRRTPPYSLSVPELTCFLSQT